MGTEQVVLAIFLLLLAGAGGFVMARLMKVSDALADTQLVLARAVVDIQHVKDKLLTHTSHIDALFEMKTMMAEQGTDLKHLAENTPQMLSLMQKLATIAISRQAA